MRELALHLLDIAQNSVAAGARNITVTVDENSWRDRLTLSVADDGKGMDAALVARVTDPFVTTRTTRQVGLGIPLLKEAAEACNGGLQIASTVGQGTQVTVEFQRSHIDRMPLGDLAGTMLTLVVSDPLIHWTLRYRVDEREFVFDDAPLKTELGAVPLTEPAVLAFVREMLEQGIKSVHSE